MRVLTKIAAAVGHLILSPLLVVLLLRRRWLMVPIIAEAILRGVLVGVVLILVVVLMLMVGQLGVVQAMLTMLAVLKVMALMGGGHGIVHVAAAIQIGIRIARTDSAAVACPSWPRCSLGPVGRLHVPKR